VSVRAARLLAGACGLTALLLVGLEGTGTADPVGMPTSPRELTAAFALLASVIVLTSATGSRPRAQKRLGLGLAACVGMLAGSLFAVPHTVILAVAWAGALLTGGTGPFDVAPAWSATAVHLCTVVSSLGLAWWLLLTWRAQRGRCPSCGRVDAAPRDSWRGRRRLPRLAAVAVLGCLPYGLLKLSWGLGSRAGLTGHAFDDVSLTSPGFGDTVVLTLVSGVTCVGMGAAVRRPLARRAALAIGTLGSAMLLPVAVVAVPQLALAALTGSGTDDSEIATWVFAVVYLSFAVWGTALALLTWTYWQVTRPACSRPFHRGVAGSPATSDPAVLS
jgi:hypothetical protein